MIPYILAVVGGYLIGDSMQDEIFADGGLVGKRIRLIKMNDDPNPVAPGTTGTIKHVGGGVMNVDWDNGRSIGVVEGVDEYEIIEQMADGGQAEIAKDLISKENIKTSLNPFAFRKKALLAKEIVGKHPEILMLANGGEVDVFKNTIREYKMYGIPEDLRSLPFFKGAYKGASDAIKEGKDTKSAKIWFELYKKNQGGTKLTKEEYREFVFLSKILYKDVFDNRRFAGYADGGGVGAKEWQIKKKDGTYFYLKMSTGSPAWSTSADMGYQYTKDEAERLKSILEKDGVDGLSIVKYDKDWWKNADEFAKGGIVKVGEIKSMVKQYQATENDINSYKKELNSEDLSQFEKDRIEDFYLPELRQKSDYLYGQLKFLMQRYLIQSGKKIEFDEKTYKFLVEQGLN